MTREFVFGLRKVAPATFAHSHTFPRSLAEALADAHLHECQNCSIHSIHLLRSVSLLSIQKSFAPLTMITFTRYPKQSLMKRSGNIEVFVVAFLRRTQDFCTRWCHSSGRARGYAQTRWQGPKSQFSMLLPFHFAFRFPSSSFCWLYISLQLSRTKPSSKLLHLAQWCRCCGLLRFKQLCTHIVIIAYGNNLRHVSNVDESKKWI